MGMNPDTNRFENLQQLDELKRLLGEEEARSESSQLENLVAAAGQLFRPNGEPVPKHWSVFKVGETYTINDYTFRCAYIGETSILFEPVGPIVIGGQSAAG